MSYNALPSSTNHDEPSGGDEPSTVASRASSRTLTPRQSSEVQAGRALSLLLDSPDTSRGCEIETKDEARKPSRTSSTGLIEGFWLLELGSMAASVACFIAIVIVLRIHDGQPLSSWTFYFSINTCISVLATASKASFLLAMSAAVSQSKWNWFRRRHDELRIFDVIDQASRGPLGNLRLILSCRPSSPLTLGAIVVLSSLSIEPTLQALISIKGALTTINGDRSTSIGRTTMMEGGDILWRYSDNISEPIFGVQAATYAGLQTNDSLTATPPLKVSCSTGNCSWPVFASFAFCSKCVDISDTLQKGDTVFMLEHTDLFIENLDGYLFKADPQISPTIQYMKGQAHTGPASTLFFRDYESLLVSYTFIKADPKYLANETAWQESNPTATECALYLCLHAYESLVSKGQIVERVVARTRKRVPNSWQPTNMDDARMQNRTDLGTIDWNPINGPGVTRSNFQLDPSDLNITGIDEREIFSATYEFLYSSVEYWRSFLGETGYVYSSDKIHYTNPTIRPFFESSNLSLTFENIAQSLTCNFRNLNHTAQIGSTQTWTIHFHVRWGFLAITASILAGGLVFFALVVFETSRSGLPAWKSSSIATMVFATNEATRCAVRDSLHYEAQTISKASTLHVKMAEAANGVELVQTHA